jgi:hypothetical protein
MSGSTFLGNLGRLEVEGKWPNATKRADPPKVGEPTLLGNLGRPGKEKGQVWRDENAPKVRLKRLEEEVVKVSYNKVPNIPQLVKARWWYGQRSRSTRVGLLDTGCFVLVWPAPDGPTGAWPFPQK